jgi:hypothetical protein
MSERIARRIDRRQSPRHIQVKLAAAAQPRWNGAASPIAQDAATLARIARYPRATLTSSALFAVAMMDFAAPSQYGRSAMRQAAE